LLLAVDEVARPDRTPNQRGKEKIRAQNEWKRLSNLRAIERSTSDSHPAGMPSQESSRRKHGSEAEKPGARFQRQPPP
jgi:hypothetical protein